MCEHSIGVVKGPQGLALYVGKAVPREGMNKPLWLVTDEMLYPNAPKGFQTVIAACQRNMKRDETILAVVKTADTKWYTSVRAAYRVDLESGTFRKIPTKGIRCENEGWGV
jgi:hypothetical protein